ncbi:sensor domain-containing phosphodiesterase [Aquisalimonas sp. 2447]|uniref:putative bifunctional diguanylate cyclase/phosphodiesterase n=1 Tax=Aquisalimonas sp. 2447 TaxID=2740807 RepID=UPI0014324DDC|nr:sensor domain-containing phosphodiesterase [Aquisalimonas sp. 2447]QIT57023.1 sensor domain-containing phosphodiesterase [Aquisalimonas sp. 2447]
MADSPPPPGVGNQGDANDEHALDGSLTANELAALLDGIREQIAIVDAAGRPRKRPNRDTQVLPVDDTAVPETERRALRDAIRECAELGVPRDTDYRVHTGQRTTRRHARLRPTGDGCVLLAWQDAATAEGTIPALSRRYQIETLLARIADNLTNATPDGIDAAIDAALAEAGRECGADLAHVYQIADSHRHLRNSHHWRRSSATGGQAPYRRLPLRTLPWVMQSMREGSALPVNRADHLPAAARHERALLAERDIQSLLAVPVTFSGELHGLIGFETVTPHDGWSRDTIYLARRLGELVAAALQRKQSEQRIFRLAYFDQLTGLPNRLLLRSRLSTLLRLRRRPFGLVLIDLDDASILNDLMGHDVGDLLLRTLSSRLQQFAGTGEILARWGGDAFMLTVPLDDDQPSRTAERLAALRHALSAPVHIDSHQIRVSSCMGMATHPRHTSEVDEMIRFAEIALNQAKRQGRDSMVVFDAEMQRRAARRNRVERRLREAVEARAFDLHYQPQVCLRSGELCGAEALIRWYDEELGQVAPDRFIDLAEETGLILPMGEWLVERACSDLARWHSQGLNVPRVAINVAGPQLLDDQLTTVLERELRRNGLPASALELEITESALMQHREPSLQLLHRLRELGIGIAVDDFGTGYSSLSQIKHLPVSKLKIDRSFIQDIFADPDDRAIVTAIIAMARQLELQVVAEGVETMQQLAFLREQRCDMVQGYIYGHAAAPTTFLRRMLDATPGRRLA